MVGICSGIVLYNYAQNASSPQLEAANDLLLKLEYDSALAIFEKIESQSFAENKMEVFVKALNGKAEVNLGLSQFDKAASILSQANKSLQQFDLADSEAELITLDNQGLLNIRQGSYPQALEVLERALQLCESKFQNSPRKISILANLGTVSTILTNYDQSIDFFKRSLAVTSEFYHEESPQIAKAYNNLTFGYGHRGDFDASLRYSQKALQINQVYFGPDHPALVNNYNNIGNCHLMRGDYSSALNYYQKALDITREKYGDKHMLVGMYMTNLSRAYAFNKAFQEAVDLSQKSTEIFMGIWGSQHPHIARALLRTALNYRELEDHQAELDYIQKALDVNLEVFGEKNLLTITTYTHLGECYLSLNEMSKSLASFQKALNLSKATLPAKNFARGDVHGSLAQYYDAVEEYDSALYHLQQAVIAYMLSEFDDDELLINPPLDNNITDGQVVTAVFNKAKIAQKKYSGSSDIKDLELSFHTYMYADSLLNFLLTSYKDQVSRDLLLEDWLPFYENAIETSMELHEIKGQRRFLDAAFHFSEKGKSLQIVQAIRNTHASKFAGVPDSLMYLESSLKADLAFYEDNLRSSSDQNDSIKEQAYRQSVFNTKRQYDDLIERLEREFPAYYRLKYQMSAATIDQIQQVLPTNSVLIEYFAGENSLKAFVITKNSSQFIDIEKPTDYQEQITAFRNSLNNPSLTVKQFAEPANKTYKLCVQPVLDHVDIDVNQLIIIPDGELVYIPFELLVPEIPESPGSFSQIDFLINHYQVSYQYSATIMLETLTRKSVAKRDELLAFAPSFGDRESSASRAMGDIPFAEQEIQNLALRFNGVNYVGSDASESVFKTEAGGYRILHLATHGIIDDAQPNLSRLLFSATNDTINDGSLYAYELYDMSLNADLVTLSACNTGAGKFKSGEGAMSLARAFAYAGSPNIVMSLWPAQDKSTAEIMDHFYGYLSQGWAKDKALRQAKLDFLASADKVRANPYFWAGFVLVGNTSPLKNNRIHPMRLIVIVITLLLFAALVRLRLQEGSSNSKD